MPMLRKRPATLRDLWFCYEMRKELGHQPFLSHALWFCQRIRHPYFWIAVNSRGMKFGTVRLDRIGGLWVSSVHVHPKWSGYGLWVFALIGELTEPSPIVGFVAAGNERAHKIHQPPLWTEIHRNKAGSLYALNQRTLPCYC
jgi:hypothetical protein